MAIRLIDEDERITVTDVDLVGRAEGDPNTSYTIRPITRDTYDVFRKKHTKPEWKRHVHTKELDEMGFTDSVIEYVLVDWTGVVFRGQAVPCTLEYKKRLDSERSGRLLDKAGFNQVQDAAEKEEARKAESFRAPA
jgi:hypothetical protein